MRNKVSILESKDFVLEQTCVDNIYHVKLEVNEAEINKHDGKFTLQAKNTVGECICNIQVTIKPNPSRKKQKQPVKKEEPKVEEKQIQAEIEKLEEKYSEPIKQVEQMTESILVIQETKAAKDVVDKIVIEQKKEESKLKAVSPAKETNNSIQPTKENVVLQESISKINETTKVEIKEVEKIKPTFTRKPSATIEIKEGELLQIEAKVKASPEPQVIYLSSSI